MNGVECYPRGWRRRLTAWFVTDACAIVAWCYFFVLNRTTIVRPCQATAERNVLFVANHQSPLDAFLIALAASFPRLLWRPSLHPWTLAAAEYWFRSRVVAWLARHLRCIPIYRNGADGAAIRRMCAVLPRGTGIVFPEGRRSRDGNIMDGHPGAGYVAWRTRSIIVPVAVHGLLEAMPYESPRPRIGRRLQIAFGDPIPCADLYRDARPGASARAIVARAMTAVRELHAGLTAAAPRPARYPLIRGTEEERLRGKVIWVTGASSGIGRSAALLGHRAGATVILSARREPALAAVAAECRGSADVHIVPLDLTDVETIPRVTEKVLGLTGHVDWVIHGAGIAARGLASSLPIDIDRRVMETNYFGVVALTKALLPAMIDRRSGTIVVVSSLTGRLGVPRMSAYAASKHALHGFFDSLRSEVRDKGIQVTIVLPGFVNTRIVAKALTGNGCPYGRPMSAHLQGMEPEECASRILAGVLARKDEFLVGGMEIYAVRFLRVSRRLVAAVVRNHPVRAYQALGSLVPGVFARLLAYRRPQAKMASSSLLPKVPGVLEDRG